MSASEPEHRDDPEGEAAEDGLQQGLRGGLLIAVPRLADPHFHRMVVLMINHDEHGAFGVVLGPAASVSVKDLCASLETEWTRPDAPPLRYGGPCEPGRIWLIYGGVEVLANTATVAPGIHLGQTVDVLRQLGEKAGVPVVVCAGYAGWGPGQLEHEMQQNSWLAGEATPALVFDTAPDQLWEAALVHMNLTPGMISSTAKASA